MTTFGQTNIRNKGIRILFLFKISTEKPFKKKKSSEKGKFRLVQLKYAIFAKLVQNMDRNFVGGRSFGLIISAQMNQYHNYAHNPESLILTILLLLLFIS